MQLRSRRLAAAALFFVPGFGIAAWVTRTPAIRDALGASTAEMGLVLFGLSAGSMVGILSAGALLRRTGTRPLVLVGFGGILLSLPLIALGTTLGSAVTVAAGLAVFGLGMGSAEVAMNVEGGEIERLGGRSFLPLMHGCFSLGTTVGAVLGIVFTAVDFPVPWHLAIVTAISLIVVLASQTQIPAGVGRQPRVPRTSSTPRRAPLWTDPRLLTIGVVVLAMALAEGTANDWLPLIMVDGHGFDEALSSAVFAGFALSMTIGRFIGGRFVDRFGRARVLAVSAACGALGIAAVAFIDHSAVAAAAVILWGLGAALGFPVALSAAGDSGPDSAARISAAATVGYIAFLVGPPVLGFLGEETGLRIALTVPLALVVIAAVFALRIQPRRAVAVEER